VVLGQGQAYLLKVERASLSPGDKEEIKFIAGGVCWFDGGNGTGLGTRTAATQRPG